MTIFYCDCFSGISGDMFLGALLDAGLPVDVLSDGLRRLNLPEFEGVAAQTVHKGALRATQLVFDLHEHDHHQADHDHEHGDQHHHHHHAQRGLHEITHLIEDSGLPSPVQQTSLKIFGKLAEAEAAVHGCPVEEVHFHEVGATDSILDIVGAAIGLHYFAIQAVYSSPLPMSQGHVHTEHGLLPLPAPATLELMRMARATTVASPATVELVTPTGAAILAALGQFVQPDMKIERVGVGAGQRDLPWPNVMRVMVGE